VNNQRRQTFNNATGLSYLLVGVEWFISLAFAAG
jgi:hypothetical protein